MKYRDMYGEELHLGDIVENLQRREIGQIVTDINGHIQFRRWKRFSTKTLNYEPLSYSAPMEAYDRPLIPRKSRFWWWRHGWCIPDVEIIQHGTVKERRPRRLGVVTFDAPIPGM